MSNQLELSTIVSRKDDQGTMIREIDGDVVMLDVQSGKYYGLEGVGARIWQLIATPQEIMTICGRLMDEYDIDRDTCEAEVLAFVSQLHELNVVELNHA